MGDIIEIEKDIKIQILWPNHENFIPKNTLNNNSIVCKILYKDFSMLFTGDIEQEAEKSLLRNYKKSEDVFDANLLKVAHHGSKTSSIEEILKKINPEIALIGVGENNTFGHPNGDVLERLESLGTDIYRTDMGGEITITVNSTGKVKVKKYIKK